MRRVLAISLAAFTLCGASRGVAIHRLSPSDAEKLLAEGGVLLLDVRTPKEFQDGHIPSAKSFPMTELPKRLKELPKDKTQPVLVYCGTGIRSAKAARILYGEGYRDVYDLSGGLRAWIAAQKPIQITPPNGKAPSSP
jgi:rhodanese-related sulfurtransferase